VGTYYRWLCDERKEFFDPGELMGPRLSLGGYGIKRGSIPYSAWVVGALMTERWSGCSVRLVGDYGDEYDCNGYSDVHLHVLRNLISMAPDDALEFLANQVTRKDWDRKAYEEAPQDREDEAQRREEHLKILREFAREDWPPRCQDENCRHLGDYHGGDHTPTRPVPESKYVRRRYVLGLDQVDASPGQRATFGAELKHHFIVDGLLFAGDIDSFALFQISVGGLVEPIVQGLSLRMVLEGFSPYNPCLSG
jgi:hypothetical protein